MKAHMKIAGLLVMTLIGSAALADSSDVKTSTRIDFNSMIEANNNTRNVLHKAIDQRAKTTDLDGESEAERAKVVNFVDVEVGWGESAPVVDRRFDSVGAARPHTMDGPSL